MAVSHIFDRYFRKHGHYPRVEVISGAQKITVEFCPGYVSIRTSSPYQAQVYITRRAFLTLLAKVLPLARKMKAHPARDHDVPAAMQEAYFQDMQLLQERRALKKAGRGPGEAERRERQRKRFLAARARAARREIEEDAK